MPKPLGTHAPRLASVRALLTTKGRREQDRFLFEGPTLLAEAKRSGIEIDAIFVTRNAYEAFPLVAEIEDSGAEVWLVEDRALHRISDLTTPVGLVATAHRRLSTLQAILDQRGLAVALADLNDPGNAGTIVRSAEAFGASGVIFGSAGVEPYHPKVVRAAMGSLFRMPICISSAPELRQVGACSSKVAGLSREGHPIRGNLASIGVLVVGHERHGLGAWSACCSELFAIPMQAGESLNAAIAASIALYEAGTTLHSEGS
jgi:TrmH family RNA methyltransferase